MKKIVILFLVAILFLTACSKDKKEEDQNEKELSNQPTFTEEDINLAKDIIAYTQQLEKEFVQKANKKLDKTRNEYREKYVGSEASKRSEKIAEDMQGLAKKVILDPLVKKYGDHIMKDGKLNTDINVDMFKWEGNDTRKIIDENRVFLSYENLHYHDPTIEYHKKYDVHELVFEVNEEKTKIFNRDTFTYEFTFYKTEDGKLIIGQLVPLKSNIYVNDFTDDKEDVLEELNQLPPLQ
ncbi:membrane lipoprotein lipid attachment site-containing protein (plasmid) [Virgibacillus necropolis]|uniref:lipoprotein n=1 Tax=Virgibacillus necropolis TaxID=163877 RepID=UPI0038501B59